MKPSSSNPLRRDEREQNSYELQVTSYDLVQSIPRSEFMSRIEAIVFDLDDTLYPEREFVVSGFAAVAERFADRLGEPGSVVRRMTELFDEDRMRVFQNYLAKRGLDEPGLLESMIATHRDHPPTLRLFEDANDALFRLRGRVRLGIVTDGRPRTQRAKMDALGLGDRVDAAVVSQELAPWICKPDPRPFEFITTKLQVQSDRMVYVADNLVKDFVAPNELGWRTIQVRRAEGLYRDTQAPAMGRPHAILPDLACLLDQLSAWGWGTVKSA